MKPWDYPLHIAARAPLYEAIRRGWARPINPLTLTFSITAACQSDCKTCRIGARHREDPSIAKRDLALDEIEKIFSSVGPVYFFNVSGGEPFLRPDLADIVRLACVHLTPRLIHIPTNALSPATIASTTRRILDVLDACPGPPPTLAVKPSVDGVGDLHDWIRGVPGSFAKLERTIEALQEIRAKDPRLHLDLGTVISTYNIDHLDELEDWVHTRGIESYRHEIAGQRAEFHNLGDPVAPAPADYRRQVARFRRKIIERMTDKSWYARTTEAVRLVYYDLAVQLLEEKRQVTPCFAGTASVHLAHDGEVWPCCVLGGQQAFGNLRDRGYDFPSLMRSTRARAVRRFIAAGSCACPMANMWLTNILLTPRHMARVLLTLARLPRPR